MHLVHNLKLVKPFLSALKVLIILGGQVDVQITASVGKQDIWSQSPAYCLLGWRQYLISLFFSLLICKRISSGDSPMVLFVKIIRGDI